MYRIFVFLMIIILSSSFPAYTLVRQDKEFKVFQFPPDMIPRIDGNPADWNIVPDHYAVGMDELRNMTNDNPINKNNGDGTFSTEQNPIHQYKGPAVSNPSDNYQYQYVVVLTVKGQEGTSQLSRVWDVAVK